MVNDYLGLGDYYFNSRNYVQAKSYYNKGLETAKRISNLDLLAKLQFKQNKLFEVMSNYQASLYAQREGQKFKDSLNNKQQHNRAIQAQILYETEKKERELTLTKNELILKDHQLEKEKWLRIAGVLGIITLFIIIYLTWHKNKAQRVLSEQTIQEIQSALQQAKDELLVKKKNITS